MTDAMREMVEWAREAGYRLQRVYPGSSDYELRNAEEAVRRWLSLLEQARKVEELRRLATMMGNSIVAALSNGRIGAEQVTRSVEQGIRSALRPNLLHEPPPPTTEEPQATTEERAEDDFHHGV